MRFSGPVAGCQGGLGGTRTPPAGNAQCLAGLALASLVGTLGVHPSSWGQAFKSPSSGSQDEAHLALSLEPV